MEVGSESHLSSICVSCGMCCDGTLFSKAVVRGQADEALALSLGLETFQVESTLYFRLPCHHFKGCCTVYDQARPHTCGAYFCKPLRMVKQGVLALDMARETIEKIPTASAEILAIAAELSGSKDYSSHALMAEIRPEPTTKIKQYPSLWLKMIGFQVMCARIASSDEPANGEKTDN